MTADVVRLLDRRRERQTSRAEHLIQIVALQARAREACEDASRERVASVLGHDVHLDATGIAFGRHAARLDDDFLEAQIVENEDRASLQALAHTVLNGDIVDRSAAVDPELRTLVEAADAVGAGLVQHGTRNDGRILADASGGGERIQHGTRERGLLSDVSDVHDRGRARDRDRLLERSHFQLAIHRRRESRRQLEAFSPDRAEAGQRERDGIEAGPQIDNPVQALTVRAHGSDLVDEGGTRGFHGHARQDRARRVSHHPRDGGSIGNLCPRDGRQEQETRNDDGTHESLVIHGLAPTDSDV